MSWPKFLALALPDSLGRMLSLGVRGANKPGQTLSAPSTQEQLATVEYVQNTGQPVTDPEFWKRIPELDGKAPTQVTSCKAQQPYGTARLWHINNDRTAAVSDTQAWLPIDADTPKGVKIQLLTSGGVATYAHYHGESFWEGWAPLPKIDKRPTSPGENDGNTKESTG